MADIDSKSKHPLINANRVEGTEVYNPQGVKLGQIDSVMLDKRKGNVVFAVMSFGGFLGLGEKHHPLPWQSLNYDEKQDGYVVNLTKEQLEKAPAFDKGQDSRLTDEAFGRSVYTYYGAQPYWF